MKDEILACKFAEWLSDNGYNRLSDSAIEDGGKWVHGLYTYAQIFNQNIPRYFTEELLLKFKDEKGL